MNSTSLVLAEYLNQHQYGKHIFFLPAVAHHVRKLNIANPEVLIHSNYLDVAIEQLEYSLAVTAFYGKDPVAVFGFVPIWEGVAESWLMVDDLARTQPIAMTKYAILAHDISKISMGLHRQQITVRISDKRAYKWAFTLGFETEAIMKSYGPDKSDYYLMARF